VQRTPRYDHAADLQVHCRDHAAIGFLRAVVEIHLTDEALAADAQLRQRRRSRLSSRHALARGDDWDRSIATGNPARPERQRGDHSFARKPLQLPFLDATIDLAVNVEALADVPKLPFLAEICRVLTTNGIFAVADRMPHRPEACCLGLIDLGQKTGLTLVYFRDTMVNVWNACRSDDRRRSQLVNRLPRYFRPLA
jgi:SAM-dependent methyltransferase